MINDLLDKISHRQYSIGIIGLGYVGLPLLWTFHKNGFPVIGFDIDLAKVDKLNNGTPYIKHFTGDMMKILSDSSNCNATNDFSKLVEVDAILMCVPTPLGLHFEPDMSYVEKTAETISQNLHKNQLVILESTTYPGTTDEIIIPLLENNSGLKAGVDFFVAYSPEREDPGNEEYNTSEIPKVVGANSEMALELALALYNTSISQTVPVSDTKTAEAVKITENVFRAVNIALVNELKIIFHKMDIDVNEVLDAAATKPFGFMKFTPGPGLGGHCIPIDPFYLTWKAKEYKEHTRFIELAGEINSAMPQFVIDQTIKALNSHKKSLNGSKILIIGLAYKKDVDDMRESPTFELMDILDKYGVEVEYFDTYISKIMPTREHAKWTGKQSIEWSTNNLSSFDAVIISTNHSNIDYAEILNSCKLIIDTRNVYSKKVYLDQKVWRA